MLSKLKELAEALIKLDEKVGFKNFMRYVITTIVVIIVFNYKTVLRGTIELVSDIGTEIHNQKIELRDELLAGMYPILTEFRSDVKADRLLYFEYHNSKENLVSIPFKYVELVQQSARYGVSMASEEKFKNINAGAITSIYEDIKLGKLVVCNGPGDEMFHIQYPGVYDLFNTRDNATKLIFISIPGIDQPIGMIAIEWIDSETEVSIEEITAVSLQNYIPRINALILSKSK